MKKKIILSITIILISCLSLVAACIYLFPMKTTPLNTTLEATKLDADGNVIGTTQIAIQGSFKEYLLNEDKMELTVAPFGGLRGINFVDRTNSMGFTPIAMDKFYQYTGMAWENESPEMLWITFITSQDFEYWVFRVHKNDEPVYYVASFSGTRTVEEIVQYFKGLAPGYKAP